MTNQELNNYIKHYLQEDKTKSAIMLNAPWGTGKSFYIQNVLRKHLNKDGKDRCIVVSLYGMEELSEISKSLYLELRVKPIKETVSKKLNTLSKGKGLNQHKHSSEVVATLVSGGKTILKGITSYHGIDLSGANNSLQELYESIDLSDKLIVFEDIERSNIDLLSLLGYINNLVEQDGAKVLLVANEEEIIKKTQVKTPEQEKTNEELLDLSFDSTLYTEETNEYLKIKEKTISDTINFVGDYYTAIKDIIDSFNNERLSMYSDEDNLKELFNLLNKKNLRSFIFACQKTVDLYKVIPEDADKEFLKVVFFGIIIYSMKIKTGDNVIWDANSNVSILLGNDKYPLFKFCYRYINEQIIDISTFTETKQELKNLRLYNKSDFTTDGDLQSIYHFYLKSEDELCACLETIEKRLQNPEDISFYEYGKLASYVVTISEYVDYDIYKIKELLISNLRGRGDKINEYYLFTSTASTSFENKRKEYNDLKDKMINSLRETHDSLGGFNYTLSNIQCLYNFTVANKVKIMKRGLFISLFDIKRLIALLYECSPSQIDKIRKIFGEVYGSPNIKNHYLKEAIVMETLSQEIEELLKSGKFDRIQLLQLKWFNNDLRGFCQNLK